MIPVEWLLPLSEDISRYLKSIEIPNHPGKFHPLLDGTTATGRSLALGFSCFALKTYYTLGFWEHLSEDKRADWIKFIQSFQLKRPYSSSPVVQNAYVDEALIDCLNRHIPLKSRLLRRLRRSTQPSYPEQVIFAETKQAIATLAQIGQSSIRPYTGFPSTVSGLNQYLQQLDWSQPWAAGGQASALAVFVVEEAPKWLSIGQVEGLKQQLIHTFAQLADPKTGSYFKGAPSSYGQVINGAMKVLSGLDWLGEPIHYPRALVDTCLSHLPEPEGCHLVDSIYVLYRCSQQIDYRKSEIDHYCLSLLELIRRHYNPDGGFSYFIGRSQTHYYGAPISDGLAVSDLHGTCLLSWALAMIFELLELKGFTWKVIKP